MSWINFSSSRFRYRSFLSNDLFEKNEQCSNILFVTPALLPCVISGDIQKLKKNATHFIDLHDAVKKDMSIGRQSLETEFQIGACLNLALLLNIADFDSKHLMSLVFSKPWERKPEFAGFDRLTGILSDRKVDSLSITGEEKGHTDDYLIWIDLLKNASLHTLLDLATNPKHKFWNILQLYVTPLSFALSLENENNPSHLLKYLQWGFHIEAGDKVIYERQAEPNPDGAFGFDAILEDAGDTIGCYNISMTTDKLDQDFFDLLLKNSDADWKSSEIDKGNSPIRIYIDHNNKNIKQKDIKAASKNTGVEVTIHSFLEGP